MCPDHLELRLKSLSNRLDVTYYLIRAEVQAAAPQGQPLSQLCHYVRTRTPSREAYTEQGLPCIKLRNVTGRLLNVTNCDCIPSTISDNFVKPNKHDIIITATGEGTAGRADIFVEPKPHVVTGENILLRPRSDRINPFCLLAMLRAPVVRKQLAHFVRGATGQTHLYWQDIAPIRLPKVQPEIQRQCEQVFRNAWAKRRLSADNILAATDIVRTAAGLSKCNVQERRLAFETRFAGVNATMRFDVEYYQPVHETIRRRLVDTPSSHLEKLARLNTTTVNPRTSPTNLYNYVDISSIDTEVGDYEATTLLGHEAPTRARRKPSTGDLIISTVRPNRNAVALIQNDTDRLVVSTGFAVLTPTAIDPLVLFAILKTEPIYAQIVRKATAAMYPAVRPHDVLDILVPDLSHAEAKAIAARVAEAIRMRKSSDQLLAVFSALGERIFA